jgi:hypothetical protein
MKIIKSDTYVNVNKCVNYVDKQGISSKKNDSYSIYSIERGH